MIVWMLYALAVAALLTLAARALEAALKLHRMPVRWAWAGAIAGALVLPTLTRLWPGGRLLGLVLPGGADAGAAGAGARVSLEGLRAQVASGGAAGADLWSVLSSGTVEAGAALAWAALTLLVAGLAARARRDVARRRQSWEPREVAGTRVLVSRDTGPAVAGLLRPFVVVPAWVLEAEPEVREMVVGHEREHLRAGDSRLLAAGLLAVALMPWNLPLWWAVRRLRLAAELDCDRRVLADGAEPRAYGSLLVAVSGRPADLPLSAAALGEPKSLLERRIRAMTRGTTRFRHGKTVVLALLAAGLVAVACDAPNPLADGSDPAPEADAAPLSETAVDELPADGGPSKATGPDEDPRLLNRQAVVDALVAHYPDELRERGIEGRAGLWLKVDESGQVTDARIRSSSGHEALDRAALKVGGTMEFEPAARDGEPVATWISQPVNFRNRTGQNEVEGQDAGISEIRIRGDSRIRLRQTTESRGDGDAILQQVPVIFIDGERLGDNRSGRLDDLSPEEIESIEVIKGGAAAELYGPEAADGVIRITTKAGSAG